MSATRCEAACDSPFALSEVAARLDVALRGYGLTFELRCKAREQSAGPKPPDLRPVLPADAKGALRRRLVPVGAALFRETRALQVTAGRPRRGSRAIADIRHARPLFISDISQSSSRGLLQALQAPETRRAYKESTSHHAVAAAQ